MRIELKLFVDVEDKTDLAEFENGLYHLEQVKDIYTDVVRVDLIDVKD